MWSGREFLDYDGYKSKIKSIWDNLWDKIDLWDDNEDIQDLDLESDEDIDVEFDEDEEWEIVGKNIKNEEFVGEKNFSNSEDEPIIKPFPKSIGFVELSDLRMYNEDEFELEDDWYWTWYSKWDLLWVITKYIEKNLDDDTDIVVSVEYSDDDVTPQKVILEPRSKLSWNWHSVYFLWEEGDEFFEKYRWEVGSSKGVSMDNVSVEKQKVQENNVKSTQKKTYSKLSQKDQREAEEIFSILF